MPLVIFTKATMWLTRSTEKVSIRMLLDQFMKAAMSGTRSMGRVYIRGPMERFTKETI